MESYDVTVAKSARDDLRKIDPQHVARIIEAVKALGSNPFPAGCRKLKGSTSTYRLRVGVYRIIYEANTGEKQLTVYYVRHRKDAYR
jgi:mRNA interferase RelE/StbE